MVKNERFYFALVLSMSLAMRYEKNGLEKIIVYKRVQ